MELSIRAKEYISTLKRDLAWVTEIEPTKQYFQRNNIELMPEVLNFQSRYSGLDFVIKNQPNKTFSAFLFSENQVINNVPLDINKVDNKYIFECGSHQTAQFNFFLTNNGEFCTINEDDSLNILNSSFDKFIEGYALRNEIYNWEENPYYFEIRECDKMLELLTLDFEPIKDCSDQFHSWWKDNDLIVEKGVWLDRRAHYLHIYGKSEKKCNLFLDKIRSYKLIK